MNHSLKYKLLLAIFLIALVCSIVLSFAPLPLICTPLEGCNAVQTSVYAKSFGIDNSYLGIAIFSVMSIVTYSHIRKPHKHKKNMINLGVFLGAMVALYFLYLQEFVIHAFCKYCLVVDFGMVIAFGIANVPAKDKNKITLEAK